jgi:hypothetical protein
MTHLDEPDVNAGRVLLGSAIMMLGTLFLMDRLDLLETETLSVYWPVILIGFGMTRIVWPPRHGAEIGGLWIALVGGLLLLDRLGIAALAESWPVFLIVAGLMVVFRAVGWLPSRPCWGGATRPWPEVRR